MKKIERSNAIRLIYKLANDKGWDYDEFHSILRDWNFENGHISTMTAVELSKVLECFGEKFFVKEFKWVTYIRLEAKRNGVTELHLANIIKKKYGKSSIYKLRLDERRSLVKILKWIGKK